ncbi:transmembrane protein, putative (Protein of unknown function, DUF599) [Tasmannia lanceolata]|uniref:transmembrane protein, putative (Protein of unknown function, DUF599) n=1 Tax=Tasmannia lanceolata TaxID=3420 RepID=UPI004062F7A1
MEERHLDFVLVPLGLLVMGIYHIWLLYLIIRFPKHTVIGLNSVARKRWVKTMMSDPMKNGVLAVQTIRNNIMASTLLATTALTLSSLISVVVSSTAKSPISSFLIYGNTTQLVSSIKYFTILLCFLVAFLCNVQSIRYYAHASFLVSVPPPRDFSGSVAYVVRCVNRGSLFWSFGLRAFYLSFSLFLWIFGPIPMFLCCCVMSLLLYFLDSTTDFGRHLHDFMGAEDDEKKMHDIESLISKDLL